MADNYVRRFCTPVELIVVILIILIPRNSLGARKYPYRIFIKGRMICIDKAAYAVLLNIFEEVKYIKSGNEAKSIIRTSEYYLSERDGQFHVQGIRYAMDHHIYLNITHHCIPDYKRDMHKNCFVQVNKEIKDDPRTTHFDLHNINLGTTHYQSNKVKCVDWPYRYPEFNETVHDDL